MNHNKVIVIHWTKDCQWLTGMNANSVVFNNKTNDILDAEKFQTLLRGVDESESFEDMLDAMNVHICHKCIMAYMANK